MVSVHDLAIKDLAAMLRQDCLLLEKVVGIAQSRLGDFGLVEAAARTKKAIEFVDSYFGGQDGLDKDLAELGRELPLAEYRTNFLQATLKFQFDPEFSSELANVIYGRKLAEQIASQYMKGYKAIFFDTLKILGCAPAVVLPRLAFLRAHESLSNILESLPDSTEELKHIYSQLGVHAISYGNAIMAEEEKK